ISVMCPHAGPRRQTRAGRPAGHPQRRHRRAIVPATGYELWTDPETYCPGIILGSDGFGLARDYR
ncbi:hypothetical protein, partial [Mycobacterium sp. Lab-001]|uniref:hypothetical protein n=1 Tax=Mycobacterium sp. Lab-001 TaxID=3410136 RepID=UPI003D186329